MIVWCGAVLWLGAVTAGFWGWHVAEQTPGPAADPTSADRRPTGAWVLTVYAHPHCPCSRATFTELAGILDHVPVRPDVEVVVVRPDDAPAGWEQGRATRLGEQIPGARVRVDAGGADARRAGATTSGHVVLTDPAGRVVFRGGITRGRGQVGDSGGRQAILAHLLGDPTGPAETPVFGCPLFSGDECIDGRGEACRQ